MCHEQWALTVKKFLRFFTGRYRYCFYSQAQKWVFRPTGATRCPDKRESWHGGADHRSAPPCERGSGPQVRSPVRVPRANFHVYRGKNVVIQPQNCQNFEFWLEICTSGRLVCNIFMKFSAFVRVYR